MQLEMFNYSKSAVENWRIAIEQEDRGLEFERVEQESNEQRIIE